MNSTRHPTTWARSLQGLVQAHAIDPDARVPLVRFYEALEGFLDREGPLALLRQTEADGVDHLDALGLLVATSEDLGAALAVIEKYQRVFSQGDRWRFTRMRDELVVRYEPWGRARRAHDALALLFVRDLGQWLPALAGVPPRQVTARLRQSRVRGLERVRFDARVDEVRFSRGCLAAPLAGRDVRMQPFLSRYLDQRLARLPEESVAARVQALAEELLASRQARLSVIASRLGSSPRTVQRQLAREGVSLERVVDEVRKRRALVLVEAGAALSEVSFALGFSEQSAFQRAFRRWTKTSPVRWRVVARPVEG